MKKTAIVVLCLLSLLTLANNAPVRKSKSGVCHTQESRYYAKLKRYTEFPDMAACVASGGRLPNKPHAPPTLES
jgi:hypothetical protein